MRGAMRRTDYQTGCGQLTLFSICNSTCGADLVTKVANLRPCGAYDAGLWAKTRFSLPFAHSPNLDITNHPVESAFDVTNTGIRQ